MSAAVSQALRVRARELVEHNARTALVAPPLEAELVWWNVQRPLTLARDLRGRVVLLAFWTSGCVHCEHVLAELMWLEQRFAGEAFTVLGVHGSLPAAEGGSPRDPSRLRHTLLREELEHPVIDDAQGVVRGRYGVRAWPTLVLLSPDGRILGQVAGEGQQAVLAALIEAALELYGERGALESRDLGLRPERAREFELPLRYPGKIAVDESSGRLWIADTGHHRIVECDLAGRFLRAFGSGERGLVDGAAQQARFCAPEGLALSSDELLVADTRNHALRSIDLASGAVSTLVGDGAPGFERSGELSSASARLNSPRDVLVVNGSITVAMAGAHQLWTLERSSGRLLPLAGDGAAGRTDGPAESARLAQPCALAPAGRNLLCADFESAALREYDTEQRVLRTLPIGSVSARLIGPRAVSAEPPDEHGHACAWVADADANRVWLVALASGALSSYVGGGEPGARDGACDEARLHSPEGLALAGDSLYVSDTLNHGVRVVDLVEHHVRSLDLSSIPLPRVPHDDTGLEAPEFPHSGGAIDHGARKLRLGASGSALELELELRAGESLAPGASAQYRLRRLDGLVAARQVAGPLTTPTTRIELRAAGDGSLELSALFYVVDAHGACRLRMHRWRFDVQLDERAPARAIRLSASLAP